MHIHHQKDVICKGLNIEAKNFMFQLRSFYLITKIAICIIPYLKNMAIEECHGCSKIEYL